MGTAPLSRDDMDQHAANYLMRLEPDDLAKLADQTYCHTLVDVILPMLHDRPDLAKFYVQVGHVFATVVQATPKMEEGVVPLLDRAYCDADYDHASRHCEAMSAASTDERTADLADFYHAFSGRPGNCPVASFADVSVADCGGMQQRRRGKRSSSLFAECGRVARSLTNVARRTDTQLSAVLDRLFEENAEGNHRVHAALSPESLQRLASRTRTVVTSSTLRQELERAKWMRLHEAMLDAKLLSVTPRKLAALERERNRLLQFT
jgi:hypothetical protein